MKNTMNVHENENYLHCEIRGLAVLRKSSLQRHIRKHTEEKRKNMHLKTRMFKHTRDKLFHCEICSAIFSQNTHLKRHELHTLERSHFIVLSVELHFHRIQISNHTCLHTLEKNPFIVKPVELHFPIIQVLKHTC